MIAYTMVERDGGFQLRRLVLENDEVVSSEPVGPHTTYEIVMGRLCEEVYSEFHYGGKQRCKSI